MIRKLFLLNLVLLYSILFIYIYRAWAAPTYYYFGLDDRAQGDGELLFSFFMLSVVTTILPRQITKYSQFFAWIIFVIVLIPSILIVSVQGFETYSSTLLVLALAFSFVLMLKIPDVFSGGHRIGVRQVDARAFFAVFFTVYLILNVAILYAYGHVMSFASLDAIYDQRFRAATSGAGPIFAYFIGALQNAFNPYLMAIGLVDRRRRWMLGLGIAGQLLIFAILAGKIVLAGILAVIGIALAGFVDKRPSVIRILLGVIAAMLITLFVVWREDFSPTGLNLEIVAMLFMRTFAIQGALTGVYADFFASHPYTYGSHIHIIDNLIDYPYEAPVGYVIGRYLVGGEGFNANSNFWATDGLGSFGLVGVVLIGAIIGIALIFVNRVVVPERLRFASIISIPYLMALSNASFFTSLISGGGFLLALFVAYGVPESRGRSVVGKTDNPSQWKKN